VGWELDGKLDKFIEYQAIDQEDKKDQQFPKKF
jgi:hypothetical protein